VLTADGERYEVRHPEYIGQTPSGRLITIGLEDDSTVTLDLLLVTGIQKTAAEVEAQNDRHKRVTSSADLILSAGALAGAEGSRRGVDEPSTNKQARDVHSGLLCLSQFNREMTRSFDSGGYTCAQDRFA